MKTKMESKVILITCASSGIGEATARHLAAKGLHGIAAVLPHIESWRDEFFGQLGPRLDVPAAVPLVV